jgi:hypothetical protein
MPNRARSTLADPDDLSPITAELRTEQSKHPSTDGLLGLGTGRSSEYQAKRMTHRVDEHPKAGLSLSGHPASTERDDSTLCFIDIVNTNVDVQLLWVFRIRPAGRHPLRHSLKRQLTCARSETDDDPVAKILAHLHTQHFCVEVGEHPRIRTVDDCLLQTSDHVAHYRRLQPRLGDMLDSTQPEHVTPANVRGARELQRVRFGSIDCSAG